MICEFMKKLAFSEEAIFEIGSAYDIINRDDEARAWLEAACENYFVNAWDYPKFTKAISEKLAISLYTVEMAMMLHAIPHLEKMYCEANIPADIMWESLEDLRFKLHECKKMHGVWGSFVAWWQRGFYSMKLVKLGRLEYETSVFPYENHPVLKQGDKVINIHIPSSGALLQQDVEASLKRAYDFYKNELECDKMPFVCHSWLLYQPTYDNVFPKGSNLARFFENFYILENTPDEKNENFWRIFYKDFSAEALEAEEKDTTLQKNLKIALKNGMTMGSGYGLFFFDGEKIESN